MKIYFWKERKAVTKKYFYNISFLVFLFISTYVHDAALTLPDYFLRRQYLFADMVEWRVSEHWLDLLVLLYIRVVTA